MREKKVLNQLWINSISKVRQVDCIGCQTKQNSQKYHSCIDDFFGSTITLNVHICVFFSI